MAIYALSVVTMVIWRVHLHPLPSASFVEYSEYMDRAMAFITSRNERIAEYASTLDGRASMPDR